MEIEENIGRVGVQIGHWQSIAEMGGGCEGAWRIGWKWRRMIKLDRKIGGSRWESFRK